MERMVVKAANQSGGYGSWSVLIPPKKKRMFKKKSKKIHGSISPSRSCLCPVSRRSSRKNWRDATSICGRLSCMEKIFMSCPRAHAGRAEKKDSCGQFFRKAGEAKIRGSFAREGKFNRAQAVSLNRSTGSNRYVERAENYARLIDVNLNLSLDLSPEEDQQWQPLWWRPATIKSLDPIRSIHASECYPILTYDENNPNSVISCLCQGQGERPCRQRIHLDDMWIQINNFI